MPLQEKNTLSGVLDGVSLLKRVIHVKLWRDQMAGNAKDYVGGQFVACTPRRARACEEQFSGTDKYPPWYVQTTSATSFANVSEPSWRANCIETFIQLLIFPFAHCISRSQIRRRLYLRSAWLDLSTDLMELQYMTAMKRVCHLELQVQAVSD